MANYDMKIRNEGCNNPDCPICNHIRSCSNCNSCCNIQTVIGPTGPTGATGPNVTDNSMSALNTSGDTIAVVLGGTPVTLADNQNLDGFTANADNQVFTVPETGKYLISYDISLTASLLLSSRVLLNGVELPGTAVSPVAAVSRLSATIISNLNAGDTLELQLYGLVGAAVLQGGNGANLTVVRLS